ncbi:MAG: DUF5009 domain-containing protein [Bacteroidota bacterium]|nr:DUF5009 domain-containing protein [Ignavibacteria bacterium]MCU7497819.1 DUF5009 domain-containing protein [Ignavibacteria bacterium]MCU7511100.1 DUF5009 domain-containing protein [Ignavibacteria bacterium]MCU7518647.1 DUF5009 domain-containing protein [Ignavibacteria bacterium]MCU7522950.1 DUF5009 domain-containing protein [Ignavibacteria bacterium]
MENVTLTEVQTLGPEIKSNEKTAPLRADALDALRGLAILAMILSGSIPFSGIAALPAWMYHAQVPPPDHIFNPNLPGITWVDLVFPFFLFAMGAAIPLALSKKISVGVPEWKLALQSLGRGLLLAAFAIYIQHIKPYSLMSEPGALTWLTGILGFILLFPMLLRLPSAMKPAYKILIRMAGYGGAAVLLSVLRYANGSGFSPNRSDIIILVLANVAFFGAVVWLFTRENVLLRLGILAFYLAIRLTQNVEGSWNLLLWYATPASWLYKLYYLQYLFIVLPGTIAGDMILKWMNSGEKNAALSSEAKSRYSLASALLFICITITLYGLFTRALVFTLLADAVICFLGYLLLRKAENATGRLYRSLFNWGVYWLLLGLFFEAFEGGIKKDKSTLSYYFVTTGLAIFCYIALSVFIDCMKKKKYFSLLISSGQNPMIAYIAGSNFIMPVLALTTLGTLLNYMLINPWLGFLKGLIFTLLVALTAGYFTKRKLFWRT